MRAVLLLCLMFPTALFGLVAKQTTVPLDEPGTLEASDATEESESQRATKAQPGRDPKEVVTEYLEKMRENESVDLVGLLGKMVKGIWHSSTGKSHEASADEVEEAIYKKSSSSKRVQIDKNYKTAKETMEVDGNIVTTKHKVKTGSGWQTATTKFEVGQEDGLIDGIETWITGPKEGKPKLDEDGKVIGHLPVKARKWLPA